jgi:phosphoribosylglycinamide formyltransferase-1
MEKLTGLKKVKTVVFISGTGSNLKNLIKFSKKKKITYFSKSNNF